MPLDLEAYRQATFNAPDGTIRKRYFFAPDGTIRRHGGNGAGAACGRCCRRVPARPHPRRSSARSSAPSRARRSAWNSAEYGFFTSAYGWFNVFHLMLILGGIILDKMGVRFTGKMATITMVAGTAVKYWAISTNSLDGVQILGMKGQVVVAALGFAVFGVGVEVAEV